MTNMICPKCSANLSIWSMDNTVCKSCGSQLESVNGRKVNITLIIIWALTGKLVVINAFESLFYGLAATVLIATPLVLLVRKAIVKYRLVNEN